MGRTLTSLLLCPTRVPRTLLETDSPFHTTPEPGLPGQNSPTMGRARRHGHPLAMAEQHPR